MAYKRISLTLPEELLRELDAAAKTDYMKRSVYIREAIGLKLRLEAAIEQEVTNDTSLSKIVMRLHRQRIATRQLNQAGPLSWSEVQD